MIKIYFDNNLLNDDNYISFNIEYKMFDDKFYLGSTSSVIASLKIPSDALPASLEEVIIKDYDENTEIETTLFTLYVDEIIINDDNEAEINLIDKMVLLQKNYDFSEYVPITAKDLLIKICDDFDITYNYVPFVNDDVEIGSYDNTITARDYISYIAEVAGCYAKIINNELFLLQYERGTDQITSDDIDSYKLGEKIKIERVVYDFGTTHYETSNDTSLNTLKLDTNNPFLQVITQNQFLDLTDNILNFEFYNIDINMCNIFYFNDTCILLDNYNILNQFNCDYGGGYVGSYITNINNQQQEETQLINNPDEK